MSQRVQAIAGVAGLALPRGWVLNAGDSVVIPDEEWAEIRADAETLGRLSDLGFTSEAPDPVPTYRDMQRALSGGSTGLEGQIDALNADLQAHKADTTDVHGISNTAVLETQAGAQAKADAAEADAKTYTDNHASVTTGVHGIADTSKLAWNQDVDVSAATEGDVLTKTSSGSWVGAPAAVDEDFYQEITFASATNVWAVDHNQNRYGLSVETFDANGNYVMGHVKYPTPNRIEIEWYYPMSGRAVVHE